MKRIAFLVLSVWLLHSNGLQAQDPKETFNKGIESLRNNKINEAVKHFSSVIAERNNVADRYLIAKAYVARGECKFALGNTKGALDDANDAIKTKAKFMPAHEFKLAMLWNMRLFKEMLVAADSALVHGPQNELFYCYKGMAYTNLYEYEKSEQQFVKALEINPLHQKSLTKRAVNYREWKQFDKAVKAFTIAFNNSEGDGGLLVDRGFCRAYLKDFDSAQIDMLRGANLDTSSRSAVYNNIAYFIKLEQKDYQGAVDYFSKAIALQPKFSYAYNNRGYAWFKMGNYKEANKDIRKSLELDPKNSYAYKNLALIAISEGKTKTACEYLNKANELGYTRDYDDEVNELIKANCSK